jgi:ankyrin repeat protein
MVSFLIDNGADANATLDTLESPLHWAVASGETLKVKLLIKAGAIVNWQDNLGYTPLHWAVYKDLLEVTQILINHGADINICSYDKKTVVEIASEKKNEKMLELLRNAS